MKLVLLVFVFMTATLSSLIWLLIKPVKILITCPDGFWCNSVGTEVRCISDNSIDRNRSILSEDSLLVGLPYVQNLNVASCGILKSEPRMFSEFTELIILDLRENKIPELKKHTFMGLTKLEDLDIRSCEVENIEPGAFAGLSILMVLSLQNNRIQTLKAHAFGGMEILERLDLSNNKIVSLEQYTFFGLNNLKYLVLSENKLRTIIPDIFYNMSALYYLDLSDNKELHTLSNTLFSKTPNLKDLRVSGCNISRISLKNLVSLENLDLRDNILQSVVILNTTTLKTVALSYNKLRIMNTQMFADMQLLAELYVDDNEIDCDCQFFEFLLWCVSKNIQTGWSDYSPVCDYSGEIPSRWWMECLEANASGLTPYITEPDNYAVNSLTEFEDDSGFIYFRDHLEPVLYSLVFVFGFTGNLIILVIASKKAMRTVPNMYIVNLAVIDILSLVLNLPIEHLDWIFHFRTNSDALCKILAFARRLSIAVSAYSVSVLSFQRYLVTVEPIETYRPTWRETGSLIFGLWLLASAMALPATFGSQVSKTCRVEDKVYSQNVAVFELFVTCLVPLLVITFSYFLTALKLVQSGQILSDHPQAKERRRIAKIVLGLGSVFLVSYVPYHIMWTYVTFSGYQTGIQAWYMYFMFTLLLVANSCFNPVALFQLKQSLQEGVESTFCAGEEEVLKR